MSLPSRSGQTRPTTRRRAVSDGEELPAQEPRLFKDRVEPVTKVDDIKPARRATFDDFDSVCSSKSDLQLRSTDNIGDDTVIPSRSQSPRLKVDETQVFIEKYNLVEFLEDKDRTTPNVELQQGREVGSTNPNSCCRFCDLRKDVKKIVHLKCPPPLPLHTINEKLN